MVSKILNVLRLDENSELIEDRRENGRYVAGAWVTEACESLGVYRVGM